MIWWKRALITSILLIVLAAGGSAFLISMALAGKTDPEKGRVIGETLGMACGAAVAFVWFAAFVFRKKPPGDRKD